MDSHNIFGYIVPSIDFSCIEHPYNKPSFLVYFVGCPIRCIDCHNKELWKINNYNCIKVSTKEVIEKIKLYKNLLNFVNSVVIIGGEPFYQPHFLLELVRSLKEIDMEVIVYSGYDEKFLLDKFQKIVNIIDYLKVGNYNKDNKCLDKSYKLASENQYFLNVKSYEGGLNYVGNSL